MQGAGLALAPIFLQESEEVEDVYEKIFGHFFPSGGADKENPPKDMSLTCDRCGSSGARNWSVISDGLSLCDQCPFIDPVPIDSQWSYPDLIDETQVEPGIFVRTCAMREITPGGFSYHTIAIATKTSRIKEVRLYYSRKDAADGHQYCVNYVIDQRAARRRALGYGKQRT